MASCLPFSFLLRSLMFTFTVCTISTYVIAQDGKMYSMAAPEEPNAIPLNTGGVADQSADESWFRQWGDPMARNITRATLTPFLADPKKANGASVIVVPGGGFMWLSMGNEGWEVAQALADQGFNAFVLKYRLHPTTPDLKAFETQLSRRFEEVKELDKVKPGPKFKRDSLDSANQLEDVQAAYSLILSKATEWRVDANHIGMMGFSAGARLTMETALKLKHVRLEFIAPIYGSLREVDVPKSAPPMFIAIAVDDILFHGQFGVVESWYKNNIPVEFHLYQNGGHGFGLGNPNRTSNQWFNAFLHWVKVNGFGNNKRASQRASHGASQ